MSGIAPLHVAVILTSFDTISLGMRVRTFHFWVAETLSDSSEVTVFEPAASKVILFVGLE
jgi:hypothetical protein